MWDGIKELIQALMRAEAKDQLGSPRSWEPDDVDDAAEYDDPHWR